MGGEPLVSPNFWEFINRITKVDTQGLRLNVITNLSDIDNVKKLLSFKDNFKEITVSASIENIGVQAEFVRNGLVWGTFQDNINYLLENNIKIRLLATMPGIALDGFVKFLDWYKPYAKLVDLEVHRLRHPVFQAPQVLPQYIKNNYAKELDEWITVNNTDIDPFLDEQLKNIVTILRKECIIYG